MRDNVLISKLKSLEVLGLKGHITVTQTSNGMGYGPNGPINGGDVEITFSRDTLVDFESLLNQKIK